MCVVFHVAAGAGVCGDGGGQWSRGPAGEHCHGRLFPCSSFDAAVVVACFHAISMFIQSLLTLF